MRNIIKFGFCVAQASEVIPKASILLNDNQVYSFQNIFVEFVPKLSKDLIEVTKNNNKQNNNFHQTEKSKLKKTNDHCIFYINGCLLSNKKLYKCIIIILMRSLNFFNNLVLYREIYK